MPAFDELSPDERRTDSFVREFETWLESHPEITLADVDNIETVIYARLRAVFTLEEMHQRAHIIIMNAEQMLHTPGVFRDPDTDEVVEPLLVENFKGDRAEYNDMMASYSRGIDDKDIASLLGEEE